MMTERQTDIFLRSEGEILKHLRMKKIEPS